VRNAALAPLRGARGAPRAIQPLERSLAVGIRLSLFGPDTVALALTCVALFVVAFSRLVTVCQLTLSVSQPTLSVSATIAAVVRVVCLPSRALVLVVTVGTERQPQLAKVIARSSKLVPPAHSARTLPRGRAWVDLLRHRKPRFSAPRGRPLPTAAYGHGNDQNYEHDGGCDHDHDDASANGQYGENFAHATSLGSTAFPSVPT
jgi:hypothetical protein